jgi:hypothetical protein
MSAVNTKLKMTNNPGKQKIKPRATAGSTNMKLCRIIILIIPDLLKPTILITPNSKDLVSTLIIRSEYISKTLRMMNKKIMMLNTRPIYRII